MKRILSSLLVIAGFAGCSTAPVATQTDLERVVAIERAASATGVKVYWVNMPKKVLARGS
jgi:hypothetical protein